MFGTITWGLVPGLEEERERSCDVLRKNKNTGWWQRWWATNNLNWKDSQKKNCHGNTAHLIWWNTRSVTTYCISKTWRLYQIWKPNSLAERQLALALGDNEETFSETLLLTVNHPTFMWHGTSEIFLFHGGAMFHTEALWALNKM